MAEMCTSRGMLQQVGDDADADAALRRRARLVYELAYLRHDAVYEGHAAVLELAQDGGQRAGQVVQQVLLFLILVLQRRQRHSDSSHGLMLLKTLIDLTLWQARVMDQPWNVPCQWMPACHWLCHI